VLVAKLYLKEAVKNKQCINNWAKIWYERSVAMLLEVMCNAHKGTVTLYITWPGNEFS
jgi:hypothetical protein